MELIVDLHIHSHYSRATSKNCNLENLYKWGKIKGINIIGTGDFTHPLWFKELKEKLEPAEPGLYKLRDSLATEIDKDLPEAVKNNIIRFILTVEISSIYKKHDKVRKVHNLIILPSFESAELLNTQLDKIGNLHFDGRPILGLDSKNLLKMSLDTDNNSLFIPAHIWTPWFGIFGSKSGFDSLEEAFEELRPEIKAIETGFSSDPYMNWRVSSLENVTITSHSDAHSPPKLGREATVLNCSINYFDIIQGIKTNDERMIGTVEFFPEEGKYHYDGHRVCKVHFTPEETKKHKGICPVCHRPLTIGVEYRVNEVAKHPENYKPQSHKSVEYIVPLVEIIGELKKVGSSSKTVLTEYEKVYSTLGNEFNILRKVTIDEIKRSGFPQLAYGVDKMRKGEVKIVPGYDGIYGTIKLFETEAQREQLNDQMSMGF